MILINHTNHPSSKWTDEQKAGFEQIVDLPFPNVDPHASDAEVRNLAYETLAQIYKIQDTFSGKKVGICLQGEFSYCYFLYDMLPEGIDIWIPTTERVSVEREGVKTSVFKFVRWRVLRSIYGGGES